MGKVIARWLHGRYHKPRRMIPSINETLSISARLHGHHSPRFCIFIAAAGAKIFMLRSMCALARVEFRVIRRGSGSASISGSLESTVLLSSRYFFVAALNPPMLLAATRFSSTWYLNRISRPISPARISSNGCVPKIQFCSTAPIAAMRRESLPGPRANSRRFRSSTIWRTPGPTLKEKSAIVR